MELFQRVTDGLPVQGLIDALMAKPELWKEITARQEAPGCAHYDTESVFLRWCKGRGVFDVFNDLHTVNYPAFYQLQQPLRELLQLVSETVFHTDLGRMMIVNLKAGGEINAHIDQGAYAEHYDRFHVALQSDEGNSFIVGGQSFHAKPGELWWFNHQQEHSVENNSNRDRWHLIIDMVAPIYRALQH